MGSYLGQNFLMNKSKLRKIADALELEKGDTIIEIGPGHGELTGEIIRELDNLEIRNFKIIAIEKDAEFAKALKEKFSKDKNIEIVEGDALKVLPALAKCYKLSAKGGSASGGQASSFKMAGNIPYYITGHLLRVISELEKKPELTVLTIQKEVAQRICAQSPRMNLLAASVQFWAEPKIIGYISKKDFMPVPRVDSAIIKLNLKNSELKAKSYKLQADIYYKLIKILFKQPRKTIFNNFCGAKKENAEECREKLLKAGINPSDRPQNLEMEKLKELAGYEII